MVPAGGGVGVVGVLDELHAVAHRTRQSTMDGLVMTAAVYKLFLDSYVYFSKAQCMGFGLRTETTTPIPLWELLGKRPLHSTAFAGFSLVDARLCVSMVCPFGLSEGETQESRE